MRRIIVINQARFLSRSLARRAEPELEKQKVEEETLPIEKKSIVRGLALNRVDDNYLVFPDYDDDAELEHVRNYLGKLGDSIDSALKVKDESKRKSAINECLKANSVNALGISTLFGGLNASKKDQVQLNELIGAKDLALTVRINNDHLVAQLIQNYGTIEQKEKFLPLLASGEVNIALCFLDDNNATSTNTKVVLEPTKKGLLNGKKQNVIEAEKADYFLVVARTQLVTSQELYCYIIPNKTEVGYGKIIVGEAKKTQGINNVQFNDVTFVDVPVSLEDVCGTMVETHDMINDYATSNRVNHAAAAIGCVKKVIANLVELSHKKRVGNNLLANNPSIQATINKLSMDLFPLETLVYYLAGMADESLYKLNDVENMICQRMANKVLRQAILTISEVAGLEAVDTDFGYAKLIKDITSVMSLSLPELTIVRAIALPTIDSYVMNSKKALNKSKFVTLKNTLFNPTENQDFKDPKAIHFLAERADPELEPFCRDLELSTYRLERLLEKVCVKHAVELKTDYYTQVALADILEAQLGMVATIARATRAAAIGLKSGIAQLGWTMNYCYHAQRTAENNCDVLREYYELVASNPSILQQGKLVLNANGYPLESPIERNW
ncbi:unnamed protein product [Bursaphelenchus okinawaensis]|uniref:Uncharacterized protein n=1 Tax=Bursaphelenchus okinawaensis TaxID=465554 RepID=A0A811JQ98_9BILA|nr:unnamed protein product [Bursaphelenchus okinawaensis]CAG9077450.1 unnamed protein product [Bursaphelenchus okinawaensis]